VEVPVSSVRVSSGVLKINNAGGTIGVRNKAYSSSSCCGDVIYRIYYGDGPLTRDGELDYANELNNDAFDLNQTGYDLAVTAYQAAAGCVLGQAGKKGGLLDSVHSAIPGWSSAINDDVTNSPAYLVGQVACGMAFPEVTLARDFMADVARGDGIGAALDSLGYLGPVKNLLGKSPVIGSFLEKNTNKFEAANQYINDLKRLGTDLSPAAKRNVISQYQVVEYNLNEFNNNKWVFTKFNENTAFTILGTSKVYESGGKPYDTIGNELGINLLKMDTGTPEGLRWSTNQQFLQIAIGKDNKIFLSVHPDVVRESIINAGGNPAESTFLKEIDYLESMGYQVSTLKTTVTRNGVTYQLYTLDKVT